MSLYRREIYILIVYLYIQDYMFNYSLYIIIINWNILLNAIVTRMNKYIVIINVIVEMQTCLLVIIDIYC